METVETFKDAIGKRITVIEVTGPAHWASYFINGDSSGFDYYNTPNDKAGDRDQAMADKFANWCGGYIVDCKDDTSFAWRHDATQFGCLACDVCTYIVHVYDKEGAKSE